MLKVETAVLDRHRMSLMKFPSIEVAATAIRIPLVTRGLKKRKRAEKEVKERVLVVVSRVRLEREREGGKHNG